MPTPYEILGVSTSSSPEEIKSAFKKLAMQHHPDRGGDAEKFKEINNAYQILTNPQKENIHIHRGPGFNPGFGFNMNDVFNEIFRNNNFGFRQDFNYNHEHQQRRNRNLRVTVGLTLEDIQHGCEKTIAIRMQNGKEKLVNCSIPPGIDNGITMHYSQIGDDSIPSVPPGDLQVVIHIRPHNIYERIPGTLDLIMPFKINAFDAILGTRIIVTTLDKKLLNVNVPEGIQPGTKIKIAGMGLNDSNGNTGDLYVDINVSIPQNLSEDQKKTLDEIRHML